ncbi:hypothetical protein PPERSA_04202 [Pseudocohnilembus persalinus]|uniref:Uncharacterized protein n=1 Tax=Pseudocohnilembus persalinus TaxID=266149 RepID=A0A0V0QN13_PSEPJ|nr:hypothetical protein PPERSA_04202 [Pseudocohnilembus persalinus]|eukprot:KRX03650.1 hypothetical protein PPERSA_04202 [Pseudocohnilembus persalinus]
MNNKQQVQRQNKFQDNLDIHREQIARGYQSVDSILPNNQNNHFLRQPHSLQYFQLIPQFQGSDNQQIQQNVVSKQKQDIQFQRQVPMQFLVNGQQNIPNQNLQIRTNFQQNQNQFLVGHQIQNIQQNIQSDANRQIILQSPTYNSQGQIVNLNNNQQNYGVFRSGIQLARQKPQYVSFHTQQQQPQNRGLQNNQAQLQNQFFYSQPQYLSIQYPQNVQTPLNQNIVGNQIHNIQNQSSHQAQFNINNVQQNNFVPLQIQQNQWVIQTQEQQPTNQQHPQPQFTQQLPQYLIKKQNTPVQQQPEYQQYYQQQIQHIEKPIQNIQQPQQLTLQGIQTIQQNTFLPQQNQNDINKNFKKFKPVVQPSQPFGQKNQQNLQKQQQLQIQNQFDQQQNQNMQQQKENYSQEFNPATQPLVQSYIQYVPVDQCD